MRTLKIALFEFKRLIRDYRLIIIFVIQPVILVFLLGNALIKEPTDIKVSIINNYENPFSLEIVREIRGIDGLDLKEATDESEARGMVEDNQTRGAVIIDIKTTGKQAFGRIIYIENSAIPEMSNRAKSKILDATQDSIALLNSPNTMAGSSLEPTVQVVSEKNTARHIVYFDFYASAIIALLVVLIGLYASVTTISQERVDGTFERFFVTPFSKANMIFGKMIAYIIMSLTLAVITIASLAFFFNVTLGPIWLVLLITFINGLAAIALGILISALTYSIGESIQVGSLVFFAVLILSGLIFYPETMHPIVKYLHYTLPFTYAIKAMREVNILGFGFSDILTDLVILAGSGLIFLSLAVLVLRRKAK